MIRITLTKQNHLVFLAIKHMKEKAEKNSMNRIKNLNLAFWDATAVLFFSFISLCNAGSVLDLHQSPFPFAINFLGSVFLLLGLRTLSFSCVSNHVYFF